MSNKFRTFTAALNNPEGAPDPTKSRAQIKFMCWNEEVGAQGTRHYQWAAYFHSAITKASAIKNMTKVFGKHAHVEIVENWDATLHYCRKPCSDEACTTAGCREVREGRSQVLSHGEFGEVPSQGERNDLAVIYESLRKKRSWAQVLQDPQLAPKVAKVHSWARQVVEANTGPQDEFELPTYEKLWPWQKDFVDILTREKPKQRRIWWVYSEDKNTGKTSLAKYLEKHCDAFMASFDHTVPNQALGRMLQTYEYQRILIVELSFTAGEMLLQDGKLMGKLTDALENLSDGKLVGGNFGLSVPKRVCAHIVLISNLQPIADWDRITPIKAQGQGLDLNL